MSGKNQSHVNLVKLCVGVDSVEDLAARIAVNPAPVAGHITRMHPKRAQELLAGGSLYWVIKGAISARQRVLALEDVEMGSPKPHCRIVLEKTLIRTQNAPRRPFQGWRYLSASDAPIDMPLGHASDDDLPEDLAQTLAEIGLV